MLSVPESYTIVNPWTMMIHIEDATVARRAVMASFWLEYVAHEAVAAPFVLVITEMEAPEDWDLPRIRRHSLEKRP